MRRNNGCKGSAAAAGLVAVLAVAPVCAIPLFDLGPGAHDTPSPIYEYYHAASDKYFVTASSDEAAALEAGAFAGWKRLGDGPAFLAFIGPVRARGIPLDQAQARPVCRYFIPPSSHFLSASEAECLAVGQAHPQFVFETAAAFYAWLPDRLSGSCPRLSAKIGGFEFQPVYRLWNGRADTNHRLTTSKSERKAMLDQGWVAEGYGDESVAMCVPRWY